MDNNYILLVTYLGIIICLITLLIVFYTQRYIKEEGLKAGFSKKEIEKWQFKAILFGSLFGFLGFKKELNKRNRQK